MSRRLLAQVLAELGGPWSARVVVGVERWLARMERREQERGWHFRRACLHWALGIDFRTGNVPGPEALRSLIDLESRASLAGEALRGDASVGPRVGVVEPHIGAVQP